MPGQFFFFFKKKKKKKSGLYMSITSLLALQYVKEETLSNGEKGKEARATRLITEHASRRIGQMAFELANSRPRKVNSNCITPPDINIIFPSAPYDHPQVKCPVYY